MSLAILNWLRFLIPGRKSAAHIIAFARRARATQRARSERV
jgi:hypothetical protein